MRWLDCVWAVFQVLLYAGLIVTMIGAAWQVCRDGIVLTTDRK